MFNYCDGGWRRKMNLTPLNVFGVNYTGPYISNGEFRKSVEFGEAIPTDALDAASRLHDSAYAHWDDDLHRMAADSLYNDDATLIGGTIPTVAGNIVLYGNAIQRASEGLSPLDIFNPATLGLKLIKKTYNNNSLLLEYIEKGDQLRKEVKDYYSTDPHPHLQGRLVGVKENKMNFLASYFYPNDFKLRGSQPEKVLNSAPDNDARNSAYSRQSEAKPVDRTGVYDPYQQIPSTAVVYNPLPKPGINMNKYCDKYCLLNSHTTMPKGWKRRNRRKKKYINTVYVM